MPTRAVILLLALVLAASGCTDPGPAESSSPADVRAAAAVGTPATPPASNAGPTPAELTAADTTLALDGVTKALFSTIMERAEAQNWQALPYGEIVQKVGESLIGQPYEAGLLDEPETETLVVTLRAFDCVLYIENVLSLAKAIALGETDYGHYVRGVRELRYRGGEMGEYCSRLHYFSDWIRDNEARGALKNITRAAGGEAFDKRIDFMSTHRDAYPHLAADSAYACIVDMEKDLAGTELFYIPQDRISEAYDALRPGDIVATATNIGGLDVTHTGFVHKTPEHTGFMHASLASDKVKISDDLESYVQGIKSQIGVVVVRPVDPRQRQQG